MLRLGCLLVVAILTAIPAVASQYLPWWGTLLVVFGEMGLLVLLGPKLVALAIKCFAIGMFKTKSEVLKGAGVHVHAVHPTDKPADVKDESEEEDEEEEDNDEPAEREPRRYVLIDFTVTPMPGASRMSHWAPSELMLVPFDLANDAKEEDYLSANVARIAMVEESGAETTDFDKINGSGRFRGVFACPASLTGRVKFRYYFEGFGDLILP